MIVSMIDDKDTQYGWSVQSDQEQKEGVKVKEEKEEREQASGITSAVTVEDNDFEL